MKIGKSLKSNITFNDIKPGMVVQRRDGNYCVMGLGNKKLYRKHTYLFTDDYNKETLKVHKAWDRYDIMKVFSTTQKFDLVLAGQIHELRENIDTKQLTLLWERRE